MSPAVSSGCVGLLGGTGEVGAAAAHRIAAAGLGPVRVGARDLGRATGIATALPGPASAVRVDLTDDADLAAFCHGCRVVVNCAGPSYLVLDRVARAALSAGAHYVDAAGDVPVQRLLSADPPRGVEHRSVVLSAGASPGLTAVLPRLLTTEGPLRCLDVFAGGPVRSTRTAAVDTLLTRGREFGLPGAEWRDGRVHEATLPGLDAVTLPGFPAPVTARPFLSAEAVRLAGSSAVDRLRAYTVFATGTIPDLLAEAWAGARPVEEHAAALVTAADREVAEHGQWFTVLAAARRPSGGTGPVRVVLSAPDPSPLSGAVVALAVEAVLAGRACPGVRFAADVLDPQACAAGLLADPAASILRIG